MGDETIKNVNREYDIEPTAFNTLFKNNFKADINDLELYGAIRTAQELFEPQYSDKEGLNAFWVNYDGKFALCINTNVNIEGNRINRLFIDTNSEIYAVSVDNKHVYKIHQKVHKCKFVGSFKDR